jgi:hypothetical protein
VSADTPLLPAVFPRTAERGRGWLVMAMAAAILAQSAVIGFLIAEHRRTTAALLDANTRLANAVEQQGKALDGVRSLLASQGYTLPPLTKPQ